MSNTQFYVRSILLIAIYSVGAIQWNVQLRRPVARAYGSFVRVGDRLFLLGGYAGVWMLDVTAYDLKTRTWIAAVPDDVKPSRRFQAAAARVHDDTLVFQGGYSGATNPTAITNVKKFDKDTNLNDLWLFNTTSHAWQELPQFNLKANPYWSSDFKLGIRRRQCMTTLEDRNGHKVVLSVAGTASPANGLLVSFYNMSSGWWSYPAVETSIGTPLQPPACNMLLF